MRVQYNYRSKNPRIVCAGPGVIAGFISEETVENDFASFVFDAKDLVFWRNLSENTLVVTNDYDPGMRDRHFFLAGKLEFEFNRYGKMKKAYEKLLMNQGFVIYKDAEEDENE